MNGRAIPGDYLFRLYVCDKGEEEEAYCTTLKIWKNSKNVVYIFSV